MLLFLAVALCSIGGLPRACAEGPDSSAATAQSEDGASACADRYNALLAQAKASLTRGDRGAAIDSLVSAQAQLHRCQAIEERDSGAVAVALYASRPIGLE